MGKKDQISANYSQNEVNMSVAKVFILVVYESNKYIFKMINQKNLIIENNLIFENKHEGKF